MAERDIQAAFLVLQGAVDLVLPEQTKPEEKQLREAVEAAIGAAFQIVETAFVDLHRIADAFELMVTNGVGVHGNLHHTGEQ